jgi:hypothetical protein
MQFEQSCCRKIVLNPSLAVSSNPVQILQSLAVDRELRTVLVSACADDSCNGRQTDAHPALNSKRLSWWSLLLAEVRVVKSHRRA